MTLSVHSFLGFINKVALRDYQYVIHNLDLNDIDWERLILNSKDAKRNEKQGQYTDGGKPLLQVCIDNEDVDTKKWQLKRLMELLLKEKDCDHNILDENKDFTMLSYCYMNKKHQAFELMLTVCKDHLSPDDMRQFLNAVNPKNNTTLYGLVFYHSKKPYYTETHDFRPIQKLELLNKKANKLVDRHRNSIDSDDNKYEILTPIYLFITKSYTPEETFDAMVASSTFKLYFGENSFSLEKSEEI
jgi:hypothetical protein